MTDIRVLDRIDADLPASLERLFAFLRIPSISTDPAYKPACAEAADWLVKELSGIGFDASARPTEGHPMVVAHWTKAGPDKPHVLFYAHYDVQPVDPISLWETPPFEPRVARQPDGSERIVARGSADDKGQLMTFVEACRAMVAETGGLPINVTILSEGEEESGSPSLVPFLLANAKELSLDVALVCDTNMWDRDTPAITTMLRGLVGEEVTITGANQDLHSGMFGGAALNPIHVLARVLAGLHDDSGRVTLPGFYDGVPEIPAEIAANWASLGFDGDAFLGAVGLSAPAGEVDRTVLEKIWSRPTAEVNGIDGGYTGDGFKTVLPAKARAKVSFRLVGDQDPDKIRASFRQFVTERLPKGAAVSFHPHGGSPALRLAFDSPALNKGRAALEEEWGRPAAVVGSGGSIPVVGHFKTLLGMDSLMVGFGLADDRIHSPNEKYEMTSFHKGIRSWARVLDALAG
ncbi:M20/M25/M40 family metallo-hydrolase [Chthonobacter albigriseus]|uniref:M20/M25/M40 family metallo-hydrolase n=1 Tax=Chthonobacter albigriseus TaxID=1683161 RepID=UPI0015EF1625|nr:M20/M25/M40 family metallo-hydrolase [Chthonobacter albigriseus]